MTINTDSLTKIEDALDAAAEAINKAITKANEDAFSSSGPSPLTIGVQGIQSTDRNVIEAVLRIAHVVGQEVTIDYTDEFGIGTNGRVITPESFIEGDRFTPPAFPLSVVASDEFRDGATRLFRLDRIQRVSC